jgi:hypothetical protein
VGHGVFVGRSKIGIGNALNLIKKRYRHELEFKFAKLVDMVVIDLDNDTFGESGGCSEGPVDEI